MSSMAWPGSSCQRAGGSALDQLARFRRGVYGCLWRRADALFETMDAVLTAGPAPSLPYLSLEPVLRRGHGMVYQGLARGRVEKGGRHPEGGDFPTHGQADHAGADYGHVDGDLGGGQLSAPTDEASGVADSAPSSARTARGGSGADAMAPITATP